MYPNLVCIAVDDDVSIMGRKDHLPLGLGVAHLGNNVHDDSVIQIIFGLVDD